MFGVWVYVFSGAAAVCVFFLCVCGFVWCVSSLVFLSVCGCLVVSVCWRLCLFGSLSLSLCVCLSLCLYVCLVELLFCFFFGVFVAHACVSMCGWVRKHDQEGCGMTALLFEEHTLLPKSPAL